MRSFAKTKCGLHAAGERHLPGVVAAEGKLIAVIVHEGAIVDPDECVRTC